jgi:hypothetical protein
MCSLASLCARAQLAVFAALVGPREWAVENGVVDRASCLAVRAHVHTRSCILAAPACMLLVLL